MSKKYLIPLFIVMAFVQLAVPAKMIYDSEMTERHGTLFKLRTAPIDPVDPFRGKYINLSYEASSFDTADTTYVQGDMVYIVLKEDATGFATIASIEHTKPIGTPDYVQAEVTFNYGGRIHFEYLFDRFYMEESKAPQAEAAYSEYSRKGKAKPAYAIVAVRDGNAVVKDVIIDGMPVKEFVIRERTSN